MGGGPLNEVPSVALWLCFQKSEELNSEFDPWCVAVVYPALSIYDTWATCYYSYVPDAPFSLEEWNDQKFPSPFLILYPDMKIAHPSVTSQSISRVWYRSKADTL